MAADKKISELGIYTISDIDNISGSLYIPVISSTTMANYKIDLVSIIRSILSKITAITPYEDLLSEGSELIDADTISTINGRINAVINRLDTLENESTWPLHNIVLTDGTNEVPYTLKTCPNGGNVDMVINTSSVTLPNFYAALSVSGNPTISGTTATVIASFSILNFYSNLRLNGGQVGTITVGGSLTVSSLNGTSTLTLLQQSVDLSENSEFDLSGNTNKSNSTTVSLTCTIPSGATILGVTLTGTINSISIPGQATYSVPNQGGFAAAGYITLSNGS